MARTTQLLIIGGGVTGAALAFTAARYSSVRQIVLLEKYDALARVNSSATHNSQTLHTGDIETNYTVQKARKVSQAAQQIIWFAEKIADSKEILFRYPKMVLGVGEEECHYIRSRHEAFSSLFPYMQLWDKSRIAQAEPAIVRRDGRARKEEIVASGVPDEYSTADFARLTREFVDQAGRIPGKQLDVMLNTQARRIERGDYFYTVTTSQGTINAEMVVVCAGGHSLLYAHRMGHGLHLSCLPVAGSFCYAKKTLNGKVYTVQNDKLPFAAIHGDPDLLVPDKTRFGPTALVLPLLERYKYSSFFDFLRVVKLDRNVRAVMRAMLADRDIRHYILENFLYELPFVYRFFFIRSVRKIIPDLGPFQISYARRIGGIRPQLIDRKQRKLALGEARIDTGDRLIFNITPSPGASSCLENARQDMQRLCSQSSFQYYDDRWQAELGE